jgi:hypothetical protein
MEAPLMKLNLALVLVCASLSGCAFLDWLLTPPTDPVTEEVLDDAPAVAIVKTATDDGGGVNWRESVLYGLVTAQNLYLANQKRKQLAAAKAARA